MSFELTYKDIANPHFLAAMKKVVNSETWKDPKKAYNAARIGTLLDSELKTFADLRQKLVTKARSYVPANDDAPTDDDKAKLEEIQAEQEKFLEVSFKLERHKIHLDDLADVKLSPNELLALEPLLDGIPA